MNIIMKPNKPIRGETPADYSETGIPDPIEIEQAHSTATNELDSKGTFNAKFRNNIRTNLGTTMDPIEFENQQRAKEEAAAATDNSIVQIAPDPIPGRNKKPIDGWLRVSVLYLIILAIFIGIDSIYSFSQIMNGFISFLIYVPQYIIAIYLTIKCLYNIFERRKVDKVATALVVFVGMTIAADVVREFIDSAIFGIVEAQAGTICDLSCWYSEHTRPAMFMFIRVLIIPCYIYLISNKALVNTEI